MRRGTFEDGMVNYVAVGATQAQDLMTYPPERSIPAEESWRIGSGEERFIVSRDALMSWTAIREGGLKLREVELSSGPAGYMGVSFDEKGKPVAPSAAQKESRVNDDGLPLIGAGMTVRISGRAGFHSADARLRVISTVEESRRVGYILGTVGGSVVSGEESFMLTWLPNDEVWFTVRAFDAPENIIYRTFPALIRRRRRELFNRYLRAISPLFTSPA